MSERQLFNPRLVLGLVAAGLVGFAALLLLIAYGGASSASRDGRAHALSVAAIGYKGLVQLVGTYHETYLISDRADFDTENLVIVALEPESRREDLQNVLSQRMARATLIVLPKWHAVPDRRRRGWVRQIGAGAGAQVAPLLGDKVRVRVHEEARTTDPIEGEDILTGLRFPAPSRPQLIDGPDLTTLVHHPAGGALVARLGEQPHYVLADPDLLNNHGLKDPATARAALTLIESLAPTGGEGIDFDLTVNGLGGGGADGRRLLRTVFEPPFVAMTLALALAAIVAGLHGAARFGPTRREARAIAFGKSALVENSASLIAQASREARLGGAYVELVRQEVARATHAPAGLSGDELDRQFDRLGGPDRPPFSELAAALHSARDRHELMAAARALFRWKKETIR